VYYTNVISSVQRVAAGRIVMMDAFPYIFIFLIVASLVQSAWRKRSRGSDTINFTPGQLRKKMVDDLTVVNPRNTWDPAHPLYHRDPD